MKKRYIVIPLLCIVLLIGIIIGVAIAMRKEYLTQLPFDHVSSIEYNGVRIVGDDGLFYLANRNGKKISDGYISLKSVNDYYEGLEKYVGTDVNVTLFDYYIATKQDFKGYVLIDSKGDEITIMGDNYSLDAENTALPYLVFTNNENGLKAVISLNRLDSDLSYRSGNELTLCNFKNVIGVHSNDDELMHTYLVAQSADDPQNYGYFRADGIKITEGKGIRTVFLKSENEDIKCSFFYNEEIGRIYSETGELIASDVVALMRDGYTDWQYSICTNENGENGYAVIFSAEKSFQLSGEEYALEKLYSFKNCIVAPLLDESGVRVLDATGTDRGTYKSVVDGGYALTAMKAEGDYYYLDVDGALLLKSQYGDMVADESLSTDTCVIFTSAEFDNANDGAWCHFAKVGVKTHSVKLVGEENVVLSQLPRQLECDAYFLTKTVSGKQTTSVLAPFSAFKQSEYYDELKSFKQNGVSWILATSYERNVFDIIDPLTARVVKSFAVDKEDFAKYRFTHEENIALATDGSDTDTAVHMSVIKLSEYMTEDRVSASRYFVIYRTATFADKNFAERGIEVTELGRNLLIDKPYDVFTAENCLVVNTASGSEVYSLDEDCELSRKVSLPYPVHSILTDASDSATAYFIVQTDSGMKGIYNAESGVVLSPYYTDITYADNGYFVVGMRGSMGVIHVENGKVKTQIDFLYRYIEPMGDNGYIATNGNGQTEIFAGGSKVLSASIQNEEIDIYCYSTDESGVLRLSLGTLISADGKLYVHYCEQLVNTVFENYECSTEIDGVLNSRAKLIYYYNGNELLNMQIILPNDVPKLWGTEENKEWYLSSTPDEQITPVTYNEIEDSIIKLYLKSE